MNDIEMKITFKALYLLSLYLFSILYVCLHCSEQQMQLNTHGWVG